MRAILYLKVREGRSASYSAFHPIGFAQEISKLGIGLGSVELYLGTVNALSIAQFLRLMTVPLLVWPSS